MQSQTKEKQKFLAYLRTALRDSLIDEVSATPKPGLVDLHDSGAHTDMDYHTFFLSTEAVVPYLADMAAHGSEWSKVHGASDAASEYTEAESLFLSLRPMGIEAEKAMLMATYGINTHKGMIFSMGILAAAAGFIFSEHGALRGELILNYAKEMCAGPLESDFSAISFDAPKTHGERLYVRYGCRGIRGEAADGFPSISRYSLPLLRKMMEQKERTQSSPLGFFNNICLQTLLELMARVDDTNVLFRTDYPSLLYVKERAGGILAAGGCFTDDGIDSLCKLNQDFIKRNISPGGCADLLAITLFLWRLEQYKP